MESICEDCAAQYTPGLLNAVMDYNLAGDGDLNELLQWSVIIEPVDEESAAKALIEEVKKMLDE